MHLFYFICNAGEVKMNPIQPFFVFATYQYYKKIVMRNGISHLYHYCQNCSDLERISAIPDGCVDIYFEKDNTGVHARACGTVLERTVLNNKLENEYFGIRFKPGVLPANLDVKMGELIGQEINLSDVVKNKELPQRIEDTEDWQQCIRLFVNDYAAYAQDDSFCVAGYSRKHLAEYIIQLMLGAMDKIKIQELSEKTGYSERYINMILYEFTGLNPKTFERIIKVQNAISRINHHQEEQLAQVGADAGYFDQAHFIREFKKQIAMTPAEYRTLVREYAYLKRLNIVSEE